MRIAAGALVCRRARRKEIEMHGAAADCTADLRIAGAQFALRVVRQGLILGLLGQRVRDRVRGRPLLDEQQGEGEEQRLEQADLIHNGWHHSK
ncbi:MAG: hypothetical protein KJ572_06180 [Gammaproteobacteria bacterium]|nr:hypothetical protein [Sideroxydans sp.]MBU3902979.1 hypothetical protein [Gammaproteobacteria bacterium]MBU4045915.1 hypothetical protein [Gammaproteobacteria bacterium]